MATYIFQPVHHLNLKQGKLIYDGVERLSWYFSCLTENYQDVCEKLQKEDLRFIKALFKILPSRSVKSRNFPPNNKSIRYSISNIRIKEDVIKYMLKVYTENIFGDLSIERKTNIERILIKYGAGFASAGFMNRSPGYAVASAIYISAGLRITLDATLTRITTFGAPVLGAYGYAKAAAEAAERLKILNPIFYTALYNAEIEMLYF